MKSIAVEGTGRVLFEMREVFFELEALGHPEELLVSGRVTLEEVGQG